MRTEPIFRVSVVSFGLSLMGTVSGLVVQTLGAQGAPTNLQKSPDPLSYQIAKEVMTLDATRTTTVTRSIVTKPAKRANATGDDGFRALFVNEKTEARYDGSAALKVVPDRPLTVSLDRPNRPFSDLSATFDIRDGNLLKGINVASTGRLGDVLTSVAKFAGTLIGALPLVADATEPPTVAVTKCDVMHKPLSELPDTVRLFLQNNESACTTWNEIDELTQRVAKRSKERTAEEEKLKGAAGSDLNQLLSRIHGLQDAVDAAQKELTDKQTTFQDRLSLYTDAQKLGARSSTDSFHKLMEPGSLLKDDAITDGMSRPDVEKALKLTAGTAPCDRPAEGQAPQSAAARFFCDTHMVVTIESPTVGAEPAIGSAITESKDFPICSRQGQTLRIRTFVSTADDKNVSQIGDVTEDVIHPSLPVACMFFKPSALADRSLVVSFDEKARPVHVERVAKSGVAAAASAIAASAASLRDEYANTLSKVVDIQKSQRSIALDALTAKIDKLKGAERLLDARQSVDATSPNFATLLRQKQTEADLASATAQLNLDVFQSTLDQQKDLKTLQAQIDVLKKQLNLLKAQVDLKNGPS